MTHTLPDYTTKYKLTTIYSQIDSGELAARLGALSRYDRRGNVIWQTGFEYGMKNWSTLISPGAGTIEASTDHAEIGEYAMKYTHQDVSGNSLMASIRIPPAVLGRQAVELAYSMDPNIAHISLEPTIYTGSYRLEPKVVIDNANDRITYVDSTGTEQVLATDVFQYNSTSIFHKLKCFYDSEKIEYIRVMLDSVTYDMTGIKMYKVTNTTAPHIWIQIESENGSADTNEMFVDNVILTQNEP
ncbi:MAG: hypothetical protein DRP09_18435 [Candidatus Thorarchaeota archaeon]|nr:MAG: hypothetical protein DRP09_18435 [Candidatus Thorarchaeota archaeon]